MSIRLAPSRFRGVLLTVVIIVGGTPSLRDRPKTNARGRARRPQRTRAAVELELDPDVTG